MVIFNSYVSLPEGMFTNFAISGLLQPLIGSTAGPGKALPVKLPPWVLAHLGASHRLQNIRDTSIMNILYIYL